MNLKFAFIETCLYWGKSLSANRLAIAFGLKRQTAQHFIDRYKREVSHDFIYNRTQKRLEPTSHFAPRFISTEPARYLDSLRGETLVGRYMELPTPNDLQVTDLSSQLQHKLRTETVQTLISALQSQRVVQIRYQSKAMLTPEPTLLSPHSLVYAGHRYHIRAYCHYNEDFRDFVLSRFIEVEETREAWVSSKEDKNWNTYPLLCFAPHPQLNEQAQKALEFDYPLEDGVLKIRTRQALCQYVRRELLQARDTLSHAPLWKEIEEDMNTLSPEKNI